MMSKGNFFSYAITSLIMALLGYFIPKLNLDISLKLTFFAISSVATIYLSPKIQEHFDAELIEERNALNQQLKEQNQALSKEISELKDKNLTSIIEHMASLNKHKINIDNTLKDHGNSKENKLWGDINKHSNLIQKDYALYQSMMLNSK